MKNGQEGEWARGRVGKKAGDCSSVREGKGESG